METSGFFRRKKVIVAAVAIIVAGALTYHFVLRKRDGIPALGYPDLGTDRFAATCDNLGGSAFQRSATPDDLREMKVSPPPMAGADSWTAIAKGAHFHLGTLFNVRPQGHVQMNTVGNWIIALDGEGEFIFEDARTDEKRSVHTNFWTVRKGTFRAKPHDYDKGDHWLEVSVPIARIYVHQGEIGLRVGEGAGGQIWLVSGTATVVWKDGRRKVITEKGMDYL